MNNKRWIITALLLGWFGAGLAIAVEPPPAAGPTPASVLDQAPADAPLVIAIPSLAALNDRVRMMANTLGVEVPEMADALAQAKAATRLQRGINDRGMLLAVLTSASPVWMGIDPNQPPTVPPIVLLIPVTDYAAFLGNFGATANPAQPVSQVQMTDGPSGFVKPLGGYAVFGPDRAVVEKYQSGRAGQAMVNRAGPLGQACLNKSQAFIYVNVEALQPTIAAGLTEARRNLDRMIGAAPGGEVTGKIMGMYLELADTVARDTSVFVLSLGIDELGVSLTKAATFKPGSQLGGYFRPGGQAVTHLNRLADQPYLIAQAADLRGIAFHTLLRNVVTRLREVPEMAFLSGAVEPMIAIYEKTTGFAQIVSPMSAGATPFAAVTVLATDDPAGTLKAYQDALAKMNNLKINLPAMPAPPGAAAQADPNAPAPQPPAITYLTSYTPNARQIDGVSVDQFTIQTILPPELMQGNPIAPMLMAMGATGTTGYAAAAQHHVVMTTSPDEQAIRTALASVKQDKGLGSTTMLSQMRAQLTPAPAVEGYLSIASVLNTANMFAPMLGVPPLQVPKDLPPVAMSMTTGDAAVTGRLYVPMAVIKAVKDAVEQIRAATVARPGRTTRPSDGPPPAPF